MAERTLSQINRAARNKGAKFERDIARALRPYWPQIRRSRDNGSSVTTDTGDLAEAGPGLFWSLKDDKAGDNSPPGLILSWMIEARDKAHGKLPLLVQKRRGHADPLLSWCWLDLADLIQLCAPGYFVPDEPDGSITPVRMELRAVIGLLDKNGYMLADGGYRLEVGP